MNKQTHYLWVMTAGCCSLCFPCRATQAQSFTPEHPQVQAMVNRGVAYLESTNVDSAGGGLYSVGSACLTGYAILNTSGDLNHPRVKSCIQVALRFARGLSNARFGAESKVVYEASVASMLLASADAVLYKTELEIIRDWLGKIQKTHGGFGYLGRPTGDTSQVQYAMLAYWAMKNAGIQVPDEPVENAIKYLQRTQDPSGGWGYQGIVAPIGLLPQDKVTKSLSTAGMGSLVIAGDILGFYGSRNPTSDEDGVPRALVLIDLNGKLNKGRKQASLRRSDIESSLQNAIRYQRNSGILLPGPMSWYYYWRYAQERYESFIEIIDGKQVASPTWYNQGVRELAGMQEEDGSWGNKRNTDLTPSDVNTAFSILFLIRSTKKSLGKISAGILTGGYGLPKNVATVQRVGDKIVGDEEISVENLLATLEGGSADDIEFSLVPESLQLSSDAKTRAAQVARLSRLLFAEDWKARRVAAKLLGRSDDINQAPVLIQALFDEDPQVPMLAEESLRLISRKLNTRLVPYDADDEQKKQAFELWKAWYQGLRPDFEIPNY